MRCDLPCYPTHYIEIRRDIWFFTTVTKIQWDIWFFTTVTEIQCIAAVVPLQLDHFVNLNDENCINFLRLLQIVTLYCKNC